MINRVQASYHSDECGRAQGTIEYLVIIAIIVVISLVVVGLTTNVVGSPSTQINSTTDKIGNLTSGGITVVESVSDSSGDSLIKLQNNSGEALTLEKISVGGNDTIYDEQLVSGDNKTFSLSDLDLSCPCVDGQEKVSCSFDFYLTTQNGLEKKQSTTVTTNCQPIVQAVNPTQVIGLGSGTLTDPWIINSCLELQNITQHLDGNYALGTDINCYETRTWNDGNGFIPIGINTSFKGNLNGRNKVIFNLNINLSTDENIGLFAATSSTSIIQNIGLIDQNVSGKNYVGGLVGQNLGLISYVYTTGITSGFGSYVVGGLIGRNYGPVSNSFTSGIVNGARHVGGLVGSDLVGSSITHSYNLGSVTGTDIYVGGIVGYVDGSLVGGSTVLNSYNKGTINGSSSYVGGIAGYNYYGSVRNSYNQGEIRGTLDYTGGIVGYEYYGSVSNVYNTTSVIGLRNYSGGLVGYNYRGIISNSYNTGPTTGVSYVGGIVGENGFLGSVTNSYWDITRTGKTVCCGAGACSCVGKNSASSDMNAWFPSIALGGDYNVPMQHNVSSANNWTFGTDANWVAQDNNYPRLSWE